MDDQNLLLNEQQCKNGKNSSRCVFFSIFFGTLTLLSLAAIMMFIVYLKIELNEVQEIAENNMYLTTPYYYQEPTTQDFYVSDEINPWSIVTRKKEEPWSWTQDNTGKWFRSRDLPWTWAYGSHGRQYRRTDFTSVGNFKW